ncbi:MULTISPECIES: electron transfer flavoprotein subunit alpha/FixB family protein [unclassified Lactobacillus]|uniref:electron transfer flavoprotein subunit alpha/FixB family protein n=1 Tax=unclassified Lactobacillus TaxID=2620435 RepID=UPI000EFC641F|nr:MULTISPECIES: electron transfer flavoprotein subunit alpha/FixB family protein [unclassified Lactobacillus]RMC47433.1 electron transfer flavoprotein subunit alpha/FixB family protein [Lactobacillus sp. ESL0230]RMC51952.1 electron transfer flavoprotein subunit alpha/FixB family protein [Lactobacillus sp. ESL0225]
MTPIYYIQLEDQKIAEGNSSNTLAGLKNSFTGPKSVLVFSNQAMQIQTKYRQAGIPTIIYQNEHYTLTNLTSVVTTLVARFTAEKEYLIICDNDQVGSSLGSRLAAALGVDFVANVQEVQQEGATRIANQSLGQTHVCRQVPLAAKSIITTSCTGVAGKANTEVEVLDWNMQQKGVAYQYVAQKQSANDLAYAKVVVAAGKGLGAAEKLQPLQQLAQHLNASVGATKAVTDQGWLDATRMIGISNLIISPTVYYAFGISGAVQHTIGMKKAKQVIAVNTDPAAPIFKLANYGIVGDANTVIEQLNQLLTE